MEEEKEKFSDKIKRQISSNVSIPIVFPKSVYEKFKVFAKEYACNTYWNAIEKLLTYYYDSEGKNVFDMMMFDKVMELEQRLNEYDEKKDEPVSREEIIRPKFGTKRKGE